MNNFLFVTAVSNQDLEKSFQSYYIILFFLVLLLAFLVRAITRTIIIQRGKRTNHGVLPKKVLQKAKKFSLISGIASFFLIFILFSSPLISLSKLIVNKSQGIEDKSVKFIKDKDHTNNYEDIHQDKNDPVDTKGLTD